MGVRGRPGPRGVPGVMGLDGAKGTVGQIGHQGPPGLPGRPGEMGLDGEPVSHLRNNDAMSESLMIHTRGCCRVQLATLGP